MNTITPAHRFVNVVSILPLPFFTHNGEIFLLVVVDEKPLVLPPPICKSSLFLPGWRKLQMYKSTAQDRTGDVAVLRCGKLVSLQPFKPSTNSRIHLQLLTPSSTYSVSTSSSTSYGYRYSHSYPHSPPPACKRRSGPLDSSQNPLATHPARGRPPTTGAEKP